MNPETILKQPNKLYDSADKFMQMLNRKIVKEFIDFQPSILNIDELNIIKRCREFYEKLNELSLMYLLLVAQDVYKKNGGERILDKKWLNKILSSFDPVTQYIYNNEIARKEQRCEESIIACMQINMAFDEPLGRAMGLWVRMVKQYADNVTDKAYYDALKQRGVKKVKWVAQTDHKTCSACRALNGHIFLLSEVPQKQHWNCRCYVVPVSSRTHLK